MNEMAAVRSANLGFPRVGARRELKRALEAHWNGAVSVGDLASLASALRAQRWRLQADEHITSVPSNDFSLYDHLLDTAVMLGSVPDRYAAGEGPGSLEAYFAMARGGEVGGRPVRALEMTKWFDTNYHYLVPEIEPGRRFELNPAKALGELAEAESLGIATRPVVLGPISFLVLARRRGEAALHSLGPDGLVDAYEELLVKLAAAGAGSVQIDEPALGLDLEDELAAAYPWVTQRLAESAPTVDLVIATYFAGLRANLALACSLPVSALHLDCVSEPDQLEEACAVAPDTLSLSFGVVDGRNVWRSDLATVLDRLERARDKLGPERLWVAPSCSLLHLPVDLALEGALAPEVVSFLAFARQRLAEVSTLVQALNEGRSSVEHELLASAAAAAARASSPLVHDPAIAARVRQTGPDDERRTAPYPERRAAQEARLGLPILPTTTIGSFPQTPEVRSLRARLRRGELDEADYEAAVREHIAGTVRLQERLGLDVLVHGEAERNDMVEYFAEHLGGFVITENGWVQSYGSRCVKPPVLLGDVRRPEGITLSWTSYAQSLTDRPVKAMLTGPLTLLGWSFVRDDQPRELTARQLALAVRDELADLEAAGCAVVQVDEPALREGLPLHDRDQPAYLDWAVRAFRLATGGCAPSTQVHTHMCYAEVDDIVEALIALDADVISLEASRSKMAVLAPLAEHSYPREVGPGLFDVHSPRIPPVAELEELLEAAISVLPIERLWANPDCGLKTRRLAEVEPALANLVEATRRVRERVLHRPG
ncbi:MAG: methionine synthase (B12-independent) [Acidimicrobiaceae bacterium]|nr:methionine synthase (B12-independent) [Acidimicrobiaceae bacterium]